MLLRLFVYALLAAMVAWGVRRIIMDWRKYFSDADDARRQRDLKESKRPDIVNLQRDKDGIFRPGAKKDDETNSKSDDQ